MYVIEHALLNLGKNKGRNILIGIILFAVITSAFVGVAIYNASGAIIQQTGAAFEGMVSIRHQRQQAIRGAGESSPPTPLTIEDFHNFADSQFLVNAHIAEGVGSIRGVGIDASFLLISPDMLPYFEAELREKGLPDDWIVYRDEAGRSRMIEPIESLQDIALTFLIIVLVFGAAIMILLSVIAIRERKYEIGVLRAMGMKKKSVALCLWVETIAITCICFILAMIAGMALAQPIANALWTGESSILITINPVTVLQILGVSVVLASLAGAAAVSRITKYEPIKILMDRN
ncbi:MAG: ABC transporter permease [Defluviitaleaceae bacterium]|nr:ABC transporter permease [Defluviitaleaceae bacterium]